MSYGFSLRHGTDDAALGDELMQLVNEIRVEQELSKTTKFAIRFEEDICEGQPVTLSAGELRAGEMLSVLVPDSDDAMRCLARGPIVKVKSSSVLGGPGSWLEVHCEDRRIEMDREKVSAAWVGNAVDIAQTVLASYDFDVITGIDSSLTFDEDDNKLNQSSPDLKLIEDLARKLNWEFWISYEVEAATLTGDPLRITEVANFKASPDYGSAAGAQPPTIDSLAGGDDMVRLELNVANTQCRNITAFDVEVDVERATEVLLEGINDGTGESDEVEADGETEAVADDAATLEQIGTARRTINTPGAGGAEDAAGEVESILADESWFISATASTSAHMLPGVVEPHQIVSVEGNGFAHSGKYQVSGVIHVINAWGHLMDLKLRRNALPESANA